MLLQPELHGVLLEEPFVLEAHDRVVAGSEQFPARSSQLLLPARNLQRQPVARGQHPARRLWSPRNGLLAAMPVQGVADRTAHALDRSIPVRARSHVEPDMPVARAPLAPFAQLLEQGRRSGALAGVLAGLGDEPVVPGRRFSALLLPLPHVGEQLQRGLPGATSRAGLEHRGEARVLHPAAVAAKVEKLLQAMLPRIGRHRYRCEDVRGGLRPAALPQPRVEGGLRQHPDALPRAAGRGRPSGAIPARHRGGA
mmetsp:Transcript_76161/g.218216  ORF Transcript_76161/g.218216 Transcript_76161/m.218216 type:complete len:254 (+) Transcript_76161:715-1476(+)